MSIDFGALERGSGEAFKSVLAKIPKSLSNDTVEQFYDASLNVLNNEDVNVENKSRVLIALCKTISEEDYLNDFVNGQYLTQLPYQNQDLQVQLFDVLYIVASSSPLSLTREVARKLEKILPASPRRSLGVLTVYGKNFDAVKRADWQPVLDLLTRPETSDIFKTRLYVKDYVSLLCLLCEKNQQYRKEKITDAWDAICSCLTVNRDESVCLCYYALCRLVDKSCAKQGQCQFPSYAVACHLRRQHCQKAALSLLMRLHPEGEDAGASDVINSLVWAAHTELNANLVLVQLAQNESLAQALVRDATWMVQELPTKVDTMRLFAVVLSHESLIEDISNKNEAIAFLRNSLELDTPGVLSAVTTFTRRFRVDKDFAKFCSDYGLLSTYFQYALDIKRNDKTSINATLLFIHTFANVAYTHDLLQTCDYVSNLVRNSDKATSLRAARVACDLAKHPKCAAKLQDLKLDDYFLDNQNDPNVKKAGAHFMKALKRAYKEEQSNANRPKQSTSTKLVTSRTYRPDPSEKDPQNEPQITRPLNRRPFTQQPIQRNEQRNEQRRNTNKRSSEVRDFEPEEQEEEIRTKNSQPDWVLDENDSQKGKQSNDNSLLIEEEEENSFESSTQLIVPPLRNAQSDNDDDDDDENDEDSNPFPPSRSNKPLPKPPSPRRSRE